MLAVRLQAPGDEPRLDAAGWEGEKTAQVDATRYKETFAIGRMGKRASLEGSFTTK